MNAQQNPMEIFQKESPEIAKVFDGLIESLKATRGLDNKTKQLFAVSKVQPHVCQ